MPLSPARPRSTFFILLALWALFYASFTLLQPALLDDADSVHAEVAREMLLRHDYITLYANGIRYLEKAPLLYWLMAASIGAAHLAGHIFHPNTPASATAEAVAARVPLALTVLALALLTEAFARRTFASTRAGLYAALILLSSPGIFLFTRILLPDALVCLWLTVALYCFYLTEQVPDQTLETLSSRTRAAGHSGETRRFNRATLFPCLLFAAACALNVLTKGLIGVLFPFAIVLVYLLLTRGWRGALRRIRQLHPLASLGIFLAIAAPWHILIALANPAQGHPASLSFTHGHWHVPLATDGNVHGWLWFYFVNEQLLRYLNLRVPRDYDTVPLYLFWGLILVWLMPFSAFLVKAIAPAISRVALTKTLSFRPERSGAEKPAAHPRILLILWAAVPLLFFSLSTRQEYYVLPALPALAILVAGWLAKSSSVLDCHPERSEGPAFRLHPQTATARTNLRITGTLLTLGTLFALATLYFLLRTQAAPQHTDLAEILQKNPSDYAMSMGHFLDLTGPALALFRLPLTLAAAGLFLGPLASCILRKQARPHAAILALAAGAFTFLLAAHLGLQTFAPVLSSQQLAAAIAPQLHEDDLIVIHQEYEFASTLGFYLHRPTYSFQNGHPKALDPIHILTDPDHAGTANYGRSSNLWYGSFFPDAPAIFETAATLAERWPGPQRIFLWQDLANQPSPLPALPGPIYVVARSGGKEIVSNQRNHAE